MNTWSEIACQHGHEAQDHHMQLVTVDLSMPHGYKNLTPIPAELAKSFQMHVWDAAPHGKHPVAREDRRYCPAHDAVSETILSHRIWEPQASAFTLAVCDDPSKGIVLDFGAQIGWFSLLAASRGMTVAAFEADRHNADLLYQNAHLNGWESLVHVFHERIGPDWELYDNKPDAPGTRPSTAYDWIRLAKIDVEGAEPEVIEGIWPAIHDQAVDYLVMEVSPVFHDRYGELVARLMDAGYEAFLPPEPQDPPAVIKKPKDALAYQLPRNGVEDRIAGWHQELVYFKRQGLD